VSATTILVLSVDEASLLEHSLPAAAAQPGAEVVVVDNACTDATRTVAERHGARVVALRERLSYAAAVNRGLAETSAPAVLLLNADCVLDDGFLAAARPQLDRVGVGSVAPLLIRATGMTPETRLDVVDAAGITYDRRRKNGLAGHGEPVAAWSRGGECLGPDGACALYRREVLDAVAYGAEVLDEDLALWTTETDLALRARRAGWRCRFEPSARAWHVRSYSPTTRGTAPARHRRLQFRNRLLVMAKNDTWRTLLPDLPWIAAYEIAALGYALLRERDLLGGYADAARAWSRMRAKRRARKRV
jgi:GT2 family glycosyltransferase